MTLGILYDKFLDLVNEIKKSEQEKSSVHNEPGIFKIIECVIWILPLLIELNLNDYTFEHVLLDMYHRHTQ